jgi:anti-anti-sigma factor
VERTPGMRAPAFEIRQWTHESGTEVIAGTGELDLHAAPTLQQISDALPPEKAADAVFDFRETCFLDSTLITVLMHHLRRCGRVRLVTAKPHVLRVLEITGMDRVFEVRSTLTEMLGAVPVPVEAEEPPPAAEDPASRLLELRLEPSPASLAQARGFAAAAARRFGLDPQKRHHFTLAANEAMTNAITHGRPLDDETIHLWVREDRETLTLGVRDGGRFKLGPPAGDPLAEGGRGLPLMSQLVDNVWFDTQHGHTEVELSQRR